MDIRSARQLLALGSTAPFTRDMLRRAYMRQLRTHSPERDPEGFRQVRAAFEWLEPHAVHALPPPRVLVVGRDDLDEDELAEAGLDKDPDDDPDDRVPATRGEAMRVRLIGVHKQKLLATRRPVAARVMPTPTPMPTRPRRPTLTGVPVVPPPAPEPEPEPEPSKDPLTLAQLVDQVLVKLEAGDINAAHELVGESRKHPLDDRRAFSTKIAQRWALTRELLKVAMGLPAPFVHACAVMIARGEIDPLRTEIVALRSHRPDQLADLQYYLRKRAPNLSKLFAGAAPASAAAAARVAAPPPPPRPTPTTSRLPAYLIGGVAVSLVSSLISMSRSHAPAPPPPPPAPEIRVDPVQLEANVRHSLTYRLDLAAQDPSIIPSQRAAARTLSALVADHAACTQIREIIYTLDHDLTRNDLANRIIDDVNLLCPVP